MGRERDSTNHVIPSPPLARLGFTSALLSDPVYTIQPVDKPVEQPVGQPVVPCKRGFTSWYLKAPDWSTAVGAQCGSQRDRCVIVVNATVIRHFCVTCAGRVSQNAHAGFRPAVLDVFRCRNITTLEYLAGNLPPPAADGVLEPTAAGRRRQQAVVRRARFTTQASVLVWFRLGFWATVCKTVRPMLSDRCLCVLSCLVLCCPICDVRALWPNGWTDQDETCHAGRPRHWPHCVRWGASSPSSKGAQPPKFSAHVYCGQTAGWIKVVLGMKVDLSPGDFTLDGDW